MLLTFSKPNFFQTIVQALFGSTKKQRKKPKYNAYKRAVYPLFKRSLDARGLITIEQLRTYCESSQANNDAEIVHLSKRALSALGYTIEAIEGAANTFIASIDDAKALVKVLPRADAVIHYDARCICWPEVDQLVSYVSMVGADCGILISFSKTTRSARAHAKENDVFGLEGFDLLHLLETTKTIGPI
jgi:hypothetical protein